MKQFTPYEYMLIEAANAFGLDKEVYDSRIQWVRDNMDNLEDYAARADEPYLYMKAVKNLRDVQAGKPTGALVRFDSVCSGIQLLSVLTRCRKGCEATGAINSGKRPNAYLAVQSAMQQILGEAIQIDYKSIKESVMTSCYGSRKVPEKHFSGNRLEAFHKACRQVAPGAFGMLNILRDTWNPNALAHEWVMPDGYYAYVPVMVSDTVQLTIEELNDAVMSTFVNLNQPKDFSVSNIANITHSIDSYVLRTVVRYCNYDKKQVLRVSNLIEASLIERELKGTEPKECAFLKRAKRLNLVDISMINHIDETNVDHISSAVLRVLMTDLNKMLEYEPFDVIPVHDSYGCSPLFMNILRGWYNEVLARLSNSNLLEDIVSQLLGEHSTIKVFDEDIADLIRECDYAIC